MKDQYYIVRTNRAGVFFGKITSREGQEVTMSDARRLWYWNGATECIQLATEGTSKPRDCKFTMPVSAITLLDAIELIPCTDVAAENLKAVAVWKN